MTTIQQANEIAKKQQQGGSRRLSINGDPNPANQPITRKPSQKPKPVKTTKIKMK